MRHALLVLALAACSRADDAKDREIAELKAKLAAGESTPQAQPTRPPPTTPLPAAPVQAAVVPPPAKPYIEAEWCIFKCFQASYAQEMITPTSSDFAMRMAAADIAGTKCADKCGDPLLSAIGCRDAEEHKDRCVAVMTEKLDAERAVALCETMVEGSLLLYCCSQRMLAKPACATIKRGTGKFFDLPQSKRIALLANEKESK